MTSLWEQGTPVEQPPKPPQPILQNGVQPLWMQGTVIEPGAAPTAAGDPAATAVGAVGQFKPAEAASAIDLSNKTGTPAELLVGDNEGALNQYNSQQAGQAAKDKTNASYIASHNFAAAVSQNDWDALNYFKQWMGTSGTGQDNYFSDNAIRNGGDYWASHVAGSMGEAFDSKGMAKEWAEENDKIDKNISNPYARMLARAEVSLMMLGSRAIAGGLLATATGVSEAYRGVQPLDPLTTGLWGLAPDAKMPAWMGGGTAFPNLSPDAAVARLNADTIAMLQVSLPEIVPEAIARLALSKYFTYHGGYSRFIDYPGTKEGITDFLDLADAIRDGKATRAEIDEFLKQGRRTQHWQGGTPERTPDVLALPPPAGMGISKIEDTFKAREVEDHTSVMDKAVAAADATETKQLSPEMIGNYVKSSPRGEEIIQLTPEIVRSMYPNDEVPHAGDGKLGWIPDLARQMADNKGHPIDVSVVDYIKNVNEALHTKLREGIIYGDHGITLEEAKLLNKNKPEDYGQPSQMGQDFVNYLATQHPAAFFGVHDRDVIADETQPMGAPHTFSVTTPEGPVTTVEVMHDAHGKQAGFVGPDGIVHEFPPEARELPPEQALAAVTGREVVPFHEGPGEMIDTGMWPAMHIIKAKPSANVARMGRMLSSSLYGSQEQASTITVKEVLQNSFDAVKDAMKSLGEKEGAITINMDPLTRAIEIHDNGIGMPPEILATKFFELAGTHKESGQSSGGLGIAKMVTLYANDDLHVITMNKGKVSEVRGRGPDLFAALQDPSLSPDISVRDPTVEDKAMFPEGHGTRISIKIPETYENPASGETLEIPFNQWLWQHPSLERSPLFHPVTVKFNGETLNIGKNFPVDKFTPMYNAVFEWGKVRIYVSKGGALAGDGYENVHVLSNGIYQFDMQLKVGDKTIDKTFYIDVAPKVKPEEVGYPFELNRQGFKPTAAKSFGQVAEYIRQVFAQQDLASSVQNFGTFSYYSKVGDLVRVSPPETHVPEKPLSATPLNQISPTDVIEVKNGRLLINNRDIPELSADQMEKPVLKLDELTIDQKKIDPSKPILHDNIEIQEQPSRKSLQQLLDKLRQELFEHRMDLGEPGYDAQYEKELQKAVQDLKDRIADLDKATSAAVLKGESTKDKFVSLVDAGRVQFGGRFDKYLSEVGHRFIALRDAVADVMPDFAKGTSKDSVHLKDNAIGVSFDAEYRGVSIRIPFTGMFINPAGTVYKDPLKAATGIVGTMIHEIAHHTVRNHNAEFPAMMQDIQMNLDALEAHILGELDDATIKGGRFSLTEFKRQMYLLQEEYQDVHAWLWDTFKRPESEVRNRGQRLKSAGSYEGRDVGADGDVQGPGIAALGPAYQRVEGPTGPGELPPEQRHVATTGPGPITTAAGANAATATRRAIKAEKKALWLHQAFDSETAAAINMTKADFARYSKDIENQYAITNEKALAAAVKEQKRRSTLRWKTEEREVREQVNTDFRYDLRFVAENYFKRGISPNSILEKGTKLTDANKDELAQALGYQSGDQMKNMMAETDRSRAQLKMSPAAYYDHMVEMEVNNRMEAKHGKLGEHVLEDARAAAINVNQLKILNDERNFLAAHVKKAIISREAAEDAADEFFGKQLAKTAVRHEREVATTGRNGLRAERALHKKKYDEALIHKNNQLFSALLAIRSRKFAKEVANLYKIVNRFRKNDAVSGVAQEYTNQVQGLLHRLGFVTSRVPADLPTAQELTDFIRKKNAEGRMIPELNLPNKPFKEFTVDDIRELKGTLDGLVHAGKAEKAIQIRDRIEKYEELVAQALKNLDELEKGGFDPRKKDMRERIAKKMRELDAIFLKLERQVDWLDHGEVNGPLNRGFFRGLKEGENWKTDKLRDVGKDLRKLNKDMGRAWRKALKDKTDNRWLEDLDNPGKMLDLQRKQMLVIALNMGSKSNQAVLLGGYHWEYRDVMAYLNQNMLPKDWEFVDRIWKLFKDHLQQDIRDVTERISGVPAPLVEPAVLHTKFGPKTGDYYPLIADPLKRLERQKERIDIDPAEQLYTVLPNPRATKIRTGAMYPLDLSLDNLASRIIETVHNLGLREAMIAARKVTGDGLIRKGISRSLGPEYLHEWDKALDDIAADGVRDTSVPAIINQVALFIRRGIIGTLLGFDIGTAVIHGTSAFANSVFELGPGRFVAAAYELMFKTPDAYKSFAKQAFTESGDMRNRQHDFDVDLRRAIDKVLSAGKLSRIQLAHLQFSTGLIRWLDWLTAIVVYHGAKNRAMTEMGMSEKDAIYYAGKIMRNAHGSNGLVDLSPVQRMGGIPAVFTMFYGYFNHNLNQTRDVVRTAEGKGRHNENKTAGEKFFYVLGATFAYITVGAIIHTLVRHASSKVWSFVDGEPDDDETPLWQQIALAHVGQLASMYPVVSSAQQLIWGHNPSPTPLQEPFTNAYKLSQDASKWFEDRPVSKKWLENLMTMPGYMGAPITKQEAKATQFLWDYLSGVQQADTVPQFIRGVLGGESQPRPRRHR